MLWDHGPPAAAFARQVTNMFTRWPYRLVLSLPTSEHGTHGWRPLLSAHALFQTIAEVADRIDGIVAEVAAQFFAELADIAFDHVLCNFLVENSIDRIENLRLADAPAPVVDQILEDAALAPWQGQSNSSELRISAIEEDPQFSDHGGVTLAFMTAPDGANPRQYFADMDRLAHHIIDASGK